MPSALPVFTLRIPEELLNKVRYISEQNKRSANKEIEYALSQYVAEYEKKHGLIKTEAN